MNGEWGLGSKRKIFITRCVRVTHASRSLYLEVSFAKILVSLTQRYIENQDFCKNEFNDF